jgi:hypothetical protein
MYSQASGNTTNVVGTTTVTPGTGTWIPAPAPCPHPCPCCAPRCPCCGRPYQQQSIPMPVWPWQPSLSPWYNPNIVYC